MAFSIAWVFFPFLYLFHLKIIQMFTRKNFRDFVMFLIFLSCLHFLRCIGTVPFSPQKLFFFFWNSNSVLPGEPCLFHPNLKLHPCWSYFQVQKQTEHYARGESELMCKNEHRTLQATSIVHARRIPCVWSSIDITGRSQKVRSLLVIWTPGHLCLGNFPQIFS